MLSAYWIRLILTFHSQTILDELDGAVFVNDNMRFFIECHIIKAISVELEAPIAGIVMYQELTRISIRSL